MIRSCCRIANWPQNTVSSDHMHDTSGLQIGLRIQVPLTTCTTPRIVLKCSSPNLSLMANSAISSSSIVWSISFVELYLWHTQPSALSVRCNDLLRSMYRKNAYFFSEQSACPFEENNSSSFFLRSTEVFSNHPSITTKLFITAPLLSVYSDAKTRWLVVSTTETFWMKFICLL